LFGEGNGAASLEQMLARVGRYDQAALAARIPDGRIDELRELQETHRWICEQARQVPGFGVDERIVLANFAYAKLAMVSDLDGAPDELVAQT
jgi:hypothetical protein